MHPVGFAAGDASLEQAEEAFASWNAKEHASKLAQCLVPFSQGDSALMVQALKDLKQPLMKVLWWSDDALDRVHNPAQDDFAGVAVGVSCFHLLNGRDVLAVRGVKVVQRTEHFVDGVQETPQVLAALLGIPLH